jgi:murein DD-endopeptidase MepM/ murein hydrolase activator NlpD
MSRLKIPALSFITLHLKKINEGLPKPKFPSESIPFNALYSGIGLLVLAAVLLGAVFTGIQSKKQDLAAKPNQRIEEQGIMPVQVAPLQEKTVLPPSVPAESLQVEKAQPVTNQSSGFQEVKGQIKDNFGWQMHPLYKDWRYHTGIDVLGEEGQNVAAIQSGQVIEIYKDNNSGLTVVVKNNNYKVYYGSLSKVMTAKGSYIDAGQELGKMGSFTAEPYSHLYLAIKKDNEYIDPALVIHKE